MEKTTISRALLCWLADFDGFTVDESIGTEQLEAVASAYGLYKTPQNHVRSYLGGGCDVTAYYRFLARQRTQCERERRDSQALLERFEQWVRARNLARLLPDLGTGRQCHHVSVSNTFSMEQQDESEAVYQLSLSINYYEEASK
ncbi:MAG: hypothetical protein RR824_10370 [Clostridia bacterium]